jgi:hypothetical protein
MELLEFDRHSGVALTVNPAYRMCCHAKVEEW